MSLLVLDFGISVSGTEYTHLQGKNCPVEHKYGNTYKTLKLAKEACLKDQDCGYIHMDGCGKEADFTFSLCKIFPPQQLISDAKECVFRDIERGKTY